MTDRTPNDADVAQLAQRHYRPEPLSRSEEEVLLYRVRRRAAEERDRNQTALPGLRLRPAAWTAASVAAAACCLALLFAWPRPPAQPLTPNGTTAAEEPTTDAAVAAEALDSLLIPTEAYTAEASEWALADLPAEYGAIEEFLLFP